MGAFGRFCAFFANRQIQIKKKDIRKQTIQLLKTQKEEDRLRKSMVILGRLFESPEFHSSKTILFYASFEGEVETFEMMRQALKLGKRVALPVILKDEKRIIPQLVDNLTEDLEFGPYGIQQPRADKRKTLGNDQLDLLIVPGVAFDRSNRRLGRGAGYYDRFLSGLPREIPAFGLAFDFQVIADLPHQEHDVPLSRVLTD